MQQSVDPPQLWVDRTGHSGAIKLAINSSHLRSSDVTIAGHAFIQNIRRGHYELGVDEPVALRVMAAFDELALAI